MSKNVIKTGPERIFEEIKNIDDGPISELLVGLLEYEMGIQRRKEAKDCKTDRSWYGDHYEKLIKLCSNKRQNQEVM